MNRVPLRPIRSLIGLNNLFLISRKHYLENRRSARNGLFVDNPQIETARTIHHWGRELIERWGISVTVEGNIPGEPVLFTPNHIGYCDIMALASLVETQFVAKKEMGEWPVIKIAMNGLSLPLVDRQLGSRSLPDVSQQVASVLKNGASVTVFPEGTSSGGEQEIMPFRPAFFQSAIEARVSIQPVAFNWSVDDGGATVSENLAYWKDHTLVPHMFCFTGLRHVDLKVTFCEPIPWDSGKRSGICQLAHDRVSEAFRTNHRC